jgi:hypothetical protein
MAWVISLIVVVLLIFYLFDIYTFNSSLRLYNQIDNDNDRDSANLYLSYAKNRIKRSPLENYRIGNVYDFMLKDNDMAHEYYLQAINQIIDTPDENAQFIQTRLRDRIDINDIFEIDDTKYNIFNLDELDNELQELERALTNMHAHNINDADNNGYYGSFGSNTLPDSKKSLEERIQWKSDSQNVHDSNINNELRKGYEQIKDDNRHNFLWEIPDIENYIRYTYSQEADDSELRNVTPALKMLEYIDSKKSTNIMKLNTSEREFVSNVFTKIYNEPDTNKRKTLMENFMLNLKESYSNGSPVCITGRTTRIMTSFADMDDSNPTLGMLKAKPVIRNEMLLKAADIRNKLFDNASEEIQDKYNKAISDNDTNTLEDSMKKEIRQMIHADYAELEANDKNFVKGVIEEIEASL